MAASVAYLLFIEIAGPHYRATFNAIICVVDGFSNLWLPLFYQFSPSWRILYWLNLGLAFAFIFPLIFCVFESPKFLISRGRFASARAVFARIAKLNRRRLFSNPLQGTGASEESSGLRELFRDASFRLPLVIICVIWFSVNLVYYGISFSLGSLQGSIYINGYLSGGAEVISCIVSGYLADFFGARNPS